MAEQVLTMLDEAGFRELARTYRRRHRVSVSWRGLDGTLLAQVGPGAIEPAAAAMAIDQALRWGDATLIPTAGAIVWAAPVMVNARAVGGVAAHAPERLAFDDHAGKARIDLRAACCDLRELLEALNLTNAAYLAQQRRLDLHERHRAEAIHSLKRDSHLDLRGLMLAEEPRLLAAVRRGDRGGARAALNRVLVAVMHHADARFDLVKSLFIELTAMLGRTAVEAGAPADRVLGESHEAIGRLGEADNLEAASGWLTDTLERLLDAMARRRSDDVLVAAALRLMQQRYAQPLSRDGVADELAVSPSHFSRLFKRGAGRTFGDMLARLRAQRMAELLARTDKPIALIAIEAGFPDQSYATKVFRRVMGVTPGAYRLDHGSRA